MPCYLYILYSEILDRYYIGISEQVEDRLKRHNRGGSKYTRPGIPWKLVYTETYDNRSEAYQRERELKKRKSRRYLEALMQGSVGSVHPD